MGIEAFEIPLPIPLQEMSSGLPDPADILYWQLAEQRVYWIDYEIDDNYNLLTLAKEIVRLNKDEAKGVDPEPITIFIHSYGGDLSQAQFLCDLIETSHIPIITVATGAAMSAGLLIFLSGKKRYAFKHSQLLIHQGSAAFSGTADEIKAAQETYERKLEKMEKYILSHTTIDKKLFDKKKLKDWYVAGDELITLGIADKLVENFSDINI